MLKVKIEGVTCDHCVRAVTRALQAVPGVEGVPEVSLPKGEALVGGTPDTAAVIRAVEAEGYTARPA